MGESGDEGWSQFSSEMSFASGEERKKKKEKKTAEEPRNKEAAGGRGHESQGVLMSPRTFNVSLGFTFTAAANMDNK